MTRVTRALTQALLTATARPPALPSLLPLPPLPSGVYPASYDYHYYYHAVYYDDEKRSSRYYVIYDYAADYAAAKRAVSVRGTT